MPLLIWQYFKILSKDKIQCCVQQILLVQEQYINLFKHLNVH